MWVDSARSASGSRMAVVAKTYRVWVSTDQGETFATASDTANWAAVAVRAPYRAPVGAICSSLMVQKRLLVKTHLAITLVSL